MQRISVKFNLDANVTRHFRNKVLAHARRSTPHKELLERAQEKKLKLQRNMARPPPMRRMRAAPLYNANASLNHLSPFATAPPHIGGNTRMFYPTD